MNKKNMAQSIKELQDLIINTLTEYCKENYNYKEVASTTSRNGKKIINNLVGADVYIISGQLERDRCLYFDFKKTDISPLLDVLKNIFDNYTDYNLQIEANKEYESTRTDVEVTAWDVPNEFHPCLTDHIEVLKYSYYCEEGFNSLHVYLNRHLEPMSITEKFYTLKCFN